MRPRIHPCSLWCHPHTEDIGKRVTWTAAQLGLVLTGETAQAEEFVRGVLHQLEDSPTDRAAQFPIRRPLLRTVIQDAAARRRRPIQRVDGVLDQTAAGSCCGLS